jgi:hypothetical protein
VKKYRENKLKWNKMQISIIFDTDKSEKRLSASTSLAPFWCLTADLTF